MAANNTLPPEVALVYEVMPCNALRTAQEPVDSPHACAYFRKWGTYHSFDYAGAAAPHSVAAPLAYRGRSHVVPELLSGCRKAPIMAVGINPNLPGWWKPSRASLNPLFDGYQNYAHYFRYRGVEKPQVAADEYRRDGGGDADTPFADLVLHAPDGGDPLVIEPEMQAQVMYQGYQSLLDGLAEKMGWAGHQLSVGEDLSYGNMVACPSARWTTVPLPQGANDVAVPPMSVPERNGIVTECFHKRAYFPRQLHQSLPTVLIVFSQSTANALIGEFHGQFTVGDPQPNEPVDSLIKREIRLGYGLSDGGAPLDARVLFSPHVTGDPAGFQQARELLVSQLAEEAAKNRLVLHPATKHLTRTRGACVFCTELRIGSCDYLEEISALPTAPVPASPLSIQPLESIGSAVTYRVRKNLIESIWKNTDDESPPDHFGNGSAA